ncbi:MAG: OsmC family protein [Candidatus Omnitrophota bacterium]
MYRVEVSSEGASYRFNVKAGGYGFAIDASGKGVTPPDALLASVGSCVGVYLRKYSDGAKLQIKDFRISVEGDLGKAPPYRFSRIDVSIDLMGAELDERRRAAMLAFIKNCPVHNTLKSSPDVNITFG